MNRVGEVVRTAQGLAILRATGDDRPEIGLAVIDESLDPVGRVVDVFGPAERPYVAVDPDGDVRLPGLLGQVLYAR
ncbi:H/ACA RNA-protein complex protein Gar1 [Halobacteriales archaeon QS_5_70_17]|jgi:RNA-binding protein|nr:MAG: H/ACA RNA-protein complex protein Gar1 [Halobacteriales archaeon QS_5_70_17]